MSSLFRQQVAELFEKLALGEDPVQVASTLRATGDHGTAADITRGLDYTRAVEELGHGVGHAVDLASRGISRVMAPAQAEGQALARELGAAAKGFWAHPRAPRLAGGALLLAPILGGALHSTQQKREDELMNLQMNPTRKMGGDLETFLEKKADAQGRMAPTIRNHMHDSFVSGVGVGIGGGVSGKIIDVLSGAAKGIWNSLMVDPKRKALFESVVRTDPVVHDALTRNPNAAQTLAEAFQTMVRFAPSLSLDVNAVRSFLREAVVGGAAGVNYATIKTLIETEKGLRTPEHKNERQK